jgi:hypothetical protein
VHLLHVTLTPSVGCHLSWDIVQPCCCGYSLIFKHGGTTRPTLVLSDWITCMSLFLGHPCVCSIYEMDIGSNVWVVLSLSIATV